MRARQSAEQCVADAEHTRPRGSTAAAEAGYPSAERGAFRDVAQTLLWSEHEKRRVQVQHHVCVL